MPVSPILTYHAEYMTALDDGSKAIVKALLRQWHSSETDLIRRLKRLVEQIETTPLSSPDQLFRLGRYRELLAAVRVEMDLLGKATAEALQTSIPIATQLGATASVQILAASGASGAILTAFQRTLDPLSVKAAASFVAPGSPLMQRMGLLYGKGWVSAFSSKFVSGIVQGRSPRDIARGLFATLETTLPSDLLRTVRTAQLWTYRAAIQDSWAQSGVVQGWVWHSAMDGRTCGACWAMHGTLHRADETLNDHYHGRCAMIPITDLRSYKPGSDLFVKPGEATFNALSQAKQQSYSATGGWGHLHQAYDDGLIDFEQMVTERIDPVYGPMRQQASLKSILGG